MFFMMSVFRQAFLKYDIRLYKKRLVVNKRVVIIPHVLYRSRLYT